MKKCLSDETLVIPLEELRVDDKLHFVEEPVEVMDREIKQLKRSRIPIIKVRWNSKRGPEFTWEREDQFRQKYPHLFTKTAPSSIIPPEHHIPLWPILGVLQIGIRAKVIENQTDPYEEVAQQGHAHPLSPAYVPDPMELDEHVPVYVPEPEHPEYHVPFDDDIQAEDQPYADDASPTAESLGYIADSDLIEDDTDSDSIDYPDEPMTEDEDPEDEDEDAKDDEPFEDSDETELFEENKTAATPLPPRSPQTRVPFSQTRLRRAHNTVRPEPPMPASMEARIAEHAATPIPPASPTYDQAPLGHRAAMIRIRDDILEEDMPPQRRFVLIAPPPGCDVAESSAAAARVPRHQYDFVDAVEASEHRMMTSIEEVNLRVIYQAQVRKQESKIFYTQLHNAQTDRKDIRLEIDVVRETHISRMEWQRQRAEDDAVRHIMRTQVLEARARIDTVEDAGSSFIIIISICIDIVIISHVHCILMIIKIILVTRQGANDAMTPESIQAMIDRAIQRNSTQDDASQNLGGGPRRPVQPARVCSYPDFMKCQPMNFKGTEGNVGLSQWIEEIESVFHISGHDAAYAMTWGTFKKKLTDKYCPNGEIKKLEIELWNLKVRGNDVAAYTQRFQELALMCTKFLADETAKIDKQNENKRKADDSSRNYQQQQPHKKQNVARAYTAGPGGKKVYTGDLPLCTKCNYLHTGQCAP
ncbi:putative reverse transcriptase domain-containing protein, partial [Tanacetum coccineum]